MVPHPSTIHTVADLCRQDLFAKAARERQVDIAAGSASRWRPLDIRVFALVALALSFRG